MSPRKLALLLFLTLSSSLLIEDFAHAQRGGRSSGGSSRSSGGSSRSSGGSSRSSSGYSGGSSRSSSSRSTSRSTPSRSSSRSTYTPSRTAPTRTTTPTRTTSPTRTTTTPSRTVTTPTSRSSSSYDSRSNYGSTSGRTSSTPTVDLSGRDSAAYTGSGRSSGTTTTTPRSTSPTTYDLSRRSSSLDGFSNSSRAGTLDDATIRVSGGSSLRPTSRTSTVPRVYGARSATDTRHPAAARRSALADRLRQATIRTTSPTLTGSASRTTAGSLVDRYTPSKNDASRSLRTRSSGMDTSRGSNVSRPGATRRAAIDRASASTRSSSARTSGASTSRTDATERAAAARKTHRIEQARADHKALRAMNARYDAAQKADPNLRKRMAAASRSVAVASDIALRSALSATPIAGLRGVDGYGNDRYGRDNGYDGYGDDGYNDRWSNYGYNNNCYSNWYWNSCFPYWNNWWWGSCSGWFFGFGWGWGGSYCYYNPWWSSPWCYTSYNYCWPTYAYCSPQVVYNYYYDEKPIEREVIAAPAAEVIGAEMLPTSQSPDVALRAATEYMALGDRAFTEGRYGDAVHYYAKAIEFAPEDGVLYLVLSDGLFATGDYHYAAFALRRALDLNPEIATLGLDKRTFYGNPADFDQQLALLERYVADHVIDADARLVLGANYLFSRQAEKCVEFFDSPFSMDLKESLNGQVLLAAALEQLASKK